MRSERFLAGALISFLLSGTVSHATQEIDCGYPLNDEERALEAAQAAWVIFADKDCEAYAYPYRASNQRDEVFRNCKIVMLMKRTDDLVATLEDYKN